MTDREKVIEGLTVHCDYFAECDECPYRNEESPGVGCVDELCNDAISLLKKQEPTFVEVDGQFGGIKYGRCPKCGKGLNEEVYPHWCGFCGQAVRWNETLKQEPDTLEPLVRLFDD